jgi:hypothetical protein
MARLKKEDKAAKKLGSWHAQLVMSGVGLLKRRTYLKLKVL